MSGVVRRPVHSNPFEGRAATIVVLLVILALLAGCGGAAPSSSVTASAAPGATRAPTSSGATGGATGRGSAPADPAGNPSPSAEPAGAWVHGVQLPPAQAVASLEPTREARSGVLADTEFRLRALDGSDPVDLAAALVADPPLDLRVRRQGNAAIVKPASPLADGQRYRLSLMATDGTVRAAWAVQAVAPLRVSSTTPGDQSTEVPLRTGIEVAFNQYGVDLADAPRFIGIRPAVAGHFEQDGRTIAFVPDRPLAPATVYTVTVREGLPLAGTDEVLAGNDVFQFETTGPGAARLHFWAASDLMEIRPTEPATIPAGYERIDDEEEDPDASLPPEPAIPEQVAVAVHRLGGMADGIGAWHALQALTSWAAHDTRPRVPTEGLRLAWEGTLRIQTLATSDGDEWEDEEATTAVRLPVALDAGWYLVTFLPEGTPRQLVLQVTDLAVYTLLTTTRSAAWVNDLATGRPVEGAAVMLDGSRLGTTGADGVVAGPTPRRAATAANDDGNPLASVIEVRAGGRGVFVPAAAYGCEKCEQEQVDHGWQTVFQSDRWEYRPTDTISAWGMARRRSSGTIPAAAEVRLATWSDTVAEATVLETRAVKPDGNGVFGARIPVKDLPYGDYRLQLLVNGAMVADRGITVAVIEKPAWTLRVAASPRAVLDGGTVLATATASFFEGTPVAGAQLKLGSGSGSGVTTNLAGTASRRMTLRFETGDDGEEWGDSEQWSIREIGVHPRLPEEAEMWASDAVAVFRAGVVLRSEALLDDDRVVVRGTVHDVALARFDRSDDRWFDDVDPYGRVRAGQRIRVRTIEHIYTTTQTGTTYDWVLKQTVAVYETVETKRDLGTRTVTSDRDGRFRATYPAAGRDRSYEVRVRTTDAQGRETMERHWASTAEMTVEDRDARIETDAPDDGVSVGDMVNLRFTGGLTGGSRARYLWLRSREGLQAAAVTSSPRWAFTFRASDVPNVVVHAVRFNGHGYEPAAWEASVPFRVADRALRITVTPDHRRYEPGDRASLTIRTADAAGRPVGTSVYLGVLDEKLVSMGLVALENPLWSLYASVGSGVVGLAWTHRGDTRDGGYAGGDTGGGDDGGGEPRTDFRDWLVARIVRTGADGVARVSFDLSDDLTSWHAFAIGIGRSLRAGEGEALMPVSLPLFADVTLAESYLVADRPIVRLRAFGTALAASDTVTYRVSSDTLAMTPVSVTARALSAASVSLPPLTAGTHRLRVEARTGSGDRVRRDTLVRSFDVVTSRATQSMLTAAELDGPTAVPVGKGLTSLVLADAGRGRVLPLLERLTDGADSVRGDQALAAGLAEQALRDGFGIEPWRGAMDADVDAWLDEGLSVRAYGGGDLELSALAAMSGDPRVGELRSYFRWAEPTTREEQVWVLAGKAAFGDAVLPDIRALAEATGLSDAERVALANAALAAGDEDLARRLLRDLLATSGEQRGRWVRLTGGHTTDEPIVLTARLAIVAASLGEPVAAQMDAYLDENTPKRTVIDLERALAAQGWVRRVPTASATAVLVVGSRRSKLRIEDSEAVSVQLTPAQAAKARLEPDSGSVIVSIRVDRPLDAATLTAPDWLEPVRTVRPSGQIGIADTVIVLIKVRRPPDNGSGCLLVREIAPSGLVPIMGSGYWDEDEVEEMPSTEGPDSVVGQVVQFCAAAADATSHQVTLRYAARVIAPGRYAWEPTLLQLSDTPEVGTVIPATRIAITATE